jgi:hypothetical protein
MVALPALNNSEASDLFTGLYRVSVIRKFRSLRTSMQLFADISRNALMHRFCFPLA